VKRSILTDRRFRENIQNSAAREAADKEQGSPKQHQTMVTKRRKQ
jgi:hypothetical protein